MNLNKKQRQVIKEKYGNKCAYCGVDLPEKGWHVDHIEPVRRDLIIVNTGGYKTIKSTSNHSNQHLEILENMNPSCAPYNLFKSTMSIEQFRNEIGK